MTGRAENTEPRAPRFEVTRWSMVLRSRGNDQEARRRALADLCEAYWFPLYAFLRQRGRGREDAQDIAQDFFAKLLDGKLLASADPGRGRFRTLLLTALRNMDANAGKAARAEKRGGGGAVFSMDADLAELRWMADPGGAVPEEVFDRVWAGTVVRRAGERLREEYAGRGKEELFLALLPRVNGATAPDGLGEVAKRLSMTEGAVKMALSRVRRHYAAALRAEIAETVGSHGDVEEELRYLLTVFL